MTWFWRWIGCLLLACLGGCQPFGPQPFGPVADAPPIEPKAVLEPIAAEASALGVNWPSSGDCRDMLPVLKRGLGEGVITGLEGTPFLLINDEPAGAGRIWPAGGGRFDAQAGASSPASDARCIIRVGSAGELRSDHRVLSREQVRSRYQNGSRSQKNPAYEVAKTRLRQAEKSGKARQILDHQGRRSPA